MIEVSRPLALAVATALIATTVGACQPTEREPTAAQISAISADLPVVVSEETPVKLDAGSFNTAYRIRLNGQYFVFKRVTGVVVGTSQALEPSSIEYELANHMPEDLGGPPGAENPYAAVIRNLPEDIPEGAGVIEPYIEGSTLKKALAVSEQQLASLEGYIVKFRNRGLWPSDAHGGNIYISSNGRDVYFKDMSPDRGMSASRIDARSEYLEGRIQYWRDVNSGRIARPTAPDVVATIPSDTDALLAQKVLSDAPPSAAATQLDSAIQNRWSSETGALVISDPEAAASAAKAAAVSFGTAFLAYAAQLAIANALTPANQQWVWDIEEAVKAINFNIANGICTVNPTSALCYNANLHRVTLSNGIQGRHGWQFTGYGNDANNVVTIQEDGSFVVYNTVSAVMMGTMFPPGSIQAGNGSTYAQRRMINFVARPCPQAGPATTDRLYVIVETGPSIGVRTVNGQVQGNVIVEVSGDGTCHLPCNDISNRRLCVEQGGACGPDAMGISRPCYLPGDNGIGTRPIGTCAEGVSFDGIAAPSCVPPVPTACASECASVYGYLDRSQRCWTTEPSPFHLGLSEQRDVTIATSCTDYPCDPYDNRSKCSAVGGFCTSSDTCVEDNFTSAGGNVLGTCRGVTNFNSTFTKPHCPQPGPGGPGPVCQDECDCCDSYQCLVDCNVEELYSAKLTHQWLYLDTAGTGTGTILDGSRGATRVRKTAMTVQGPAVTLTAQPAPGSSFVSWSGCTSVSGTQCIVQADHTRTVTANFAAAPPQLSISGAFVAGYDATTVTAVALGTFAPSGNQVTLTCSGYGPPAVLDPATTYNTASFIYFIYPRVFGPGSAICHVRVGFGGATSPTVTLSGFADLADSDPFAPFAYQAFERAIIPACGSPLSFCPNNALTRTDVAAFVIRALYGEGFSYSSYPYFDDVPFYDPNFRYVQKFRDLGITIGCADRRFCASQLVTRSEVAVFLIRAIQTKNGRPINSFGYPASPFFTDVPSSDGRFAYIQAMRAAGITIGCTTTTYCPNDSVTRGQLAVFLGRGLFGSLTLPDP